MQTSTVRRSAAALLFFVLVLGALSARAQVDPSAYARGMSIAAGGEVSGFQPDYAGNRVPQAAPFSGYLAGIGTYVDVKFTPWVQLEGEGRWMRFNQPDKGIYEDNYLVGPRLPIYKLHFWHATPYAKALIGFGKLNFEDGNGWGRYTAIAYGGGLEMKLSRRLTMRLPDFEYQQWLNWSEGTGKAANLFPYGISVGVSYRIFGLR
jgi:opacity protein-like surface antigen